MNYPEQDQNQQHWEKMTSPAEEDRHPQLNCTVCGPKTGFSGCLCNAKNENGSDTDRSEGTLIYFEVRITTEVSQT